MGDPTELYTVMLSLYHSQFGLLCLYWLSMLLGIVVSPVFYSFCCIHLVVHFDELENVVKAITQNISSLIITSSAACLVVYVFAVVAFHFFREDMTDPLTGEPVCFTLAECFSFIFFEGVRAGGGLADTWKPVKYYADEGSQWLGHATFEMGFWAFIIVIVMNILSGIVIDTFADLRGKREAKLYDMTNVCFVCGLERTLIDRSGPASHPGFDYHIKHEHDIWMYA